MALLNRTGAELICLALKDAGVDWVYGIPGVHNLALYEALRRARIRVVVPCHEQGGAFMALGQSYATQSPGVLVTVPGPGLTNALTGIAEAYLDSIPLVAIVTNIRFDLPHRHQLHQIDQVTLAQPVCKEVLCVRDPDEVVAQMAHAFHLATESGEPGPVVVDIAAEVLWDSPQKVFTPASSPIEIVTPQVDPLAIKEAVTRLIASSRVSLFVGQGAIEARDDIRELAEWLNAPIATTHSGRGLIREDHPLVMDFLWRSGGVEAANAVFAGCNLALALGVKFSEHGTRGYGLILPDKVIHIDRCAGIVAEDRRSVQAVCMDVGEFVRALLAEKDQYGPRQSLAATVHADLADAHAQVRHAPDTAFCLVGDEKHSAAAFFETLRAVLPDDAVLVTDSGQHQTLASDHFPVYQPHTLLAPADYQAMGYAIPTAVGVALAQPDRDVVVVVGDGSFVMSGLELLTAVRERVRLKVLLFNNDGYGILRDIQVEQFGVATNVTLANPDFPRLVSSLGVGVHSAAGSLRDTLRDFVRAPGVRLLEIGVTGKTRKTTGTLRRRMKADLRQLVHDVVG